MKGLCLKVLVVLFCSGVQGYESNLKQPKADGTSPSLAHVVAVENAVEIPFDSIGEVALFNFTLKVNCKEVNYLRQAVDGHASNLCVRAYDFEDVNSHQSSLHAKNTWVVSHVCQDLEATHNLRFTSQLQTSRYDESMTSAVLSVGDDGSGCLFRSTPQLLEVFLCTDGSVQRPTSDKTTALIVNIPTFLYSGRRSSCKDYFLDSQLSTTISNAFSIFRRINIGYSLLEYARMVHTGSLSGICARDELRSLFLIRLLKDKGCEDATGCARSIKFAIESSRIVTALVQKMVVPENRDFIRLSGRPLLLEQRSKELSFYDGNIRLGIYLDFQMMGVFNVDIMSLDWFLSLARSEVMERFDVTYLLPHDCSSGEWWCAISEDLERLHPGKVKSFFPSEGYPENVDMILCPNERSPICMNAAFHTLSALGTVVPLFRRTRPPSLSPIRNFVAATRAVMENMSLSNDQLFIRHVPMPPQTLLAATKLTLETLEKKSRGVNVAIVDSPKLPVIPPCQDLGMNVSMIIAGTLLKVDSTADVNFLVFGENVTRARLEELERDIRGIIGSQRKVRTSIRLLKFDMLKSLRACITSNAKSTCLSHVFLKKQIDIVVASPRPWRSHCVEMVMECSLRSDSNITSELYGSARYHEIQFHTWAVTAAAAAGVPFVGTCGDATAELMGTAKPLACWSEEKNNKADLSKLICDSKDKSVVAPGVLVGSTLPAGYDLENPEHPSVEDFFSSVSSVVSWLIEDGRMYLGDMGRAGIRISEDLYRKGREGVGTFSQTLYEIAELSKASHVKGGLEIRRAFEVENSWCQAVQSISGDVGSGIDGVNYTPFYMDGDNAISYLLRAAARRCTSEAEAMKVRAAQSHAMLALGNRRIPAMLRVAKESTYQGFTEVVGREVILEDGKRGPPQCTKAYKQGGIWKETEKLDLLWGADSALIASKLVWNPTSEDKCHLYRFTSRESSGAAYSCLKRQWIHIVGDSTMRHVFFVLCAALGMPYDTEGPYSTNHRVHNGELPMICGHESLLHSTLQDAAISGVFSGDKPLVTFTFQHNPFPGPVPLISSNTVDRRQGVDALLDRDKTFAEHVGRGPSIVLMHQSNWPILASSPCSSLSRIFAEECDVELHNASEWLYLVMKYSVRIYQEAFPDSQIAIRSPLGAQNVTWMPDAIQHESSFILRQVASEDDIPYVDFGPIFSGKVPFYVSRDHSVHIHFKGPELSATVDILLNSICKVTRGALAG